MWLNLSLATALLAGAILAPTDPVLAALPGLDTFNSSNVILMERQPIHSGRQVLKFVTDRKPTFAGVDPYNFYIDRNSGDNVIEVQ